MNKRLWILAIILLLAWAGTTAAAQAQSCAPEAEPNNDPASAQALAGCAAGGLTENDQDIYRFSVPSDQAGRAFALVLDGVPDALTKADLLRVRGTDRPQTLYTLASPRGGEVRSGAFILSAGDYLVGVYGFGIGAYQVKLEPGDAPPPSGDKEPNDRQDQATKVAGAFALSGATASDGDRYAWTLAPGDAAQSWSVTAQVSLERRIDLWLYDASGVLLARRGRDALGRASFAGLKLAPGAYFLELQGDGEANNAYRLAAAATGAPAPGAEAEPNDQPEQANLWTLAAPVTGQLNGASDTDMVRFTVDQAGADARFDLRLRSDSRSRRTVCLRYPDGTHLQCRDGLGEVALPDLALAPGDYLLAISGDADPAEHYTLTRTVTGARETGREDEPNDIFQAASPLDPQDRARGRFAGLDTDIYRLVVTGKPQLWRIQITGGGLGQVRILNAVGDVEQSADAISQRRLRFTNIYLLPGTHYIDVRGENSDYRVMAIPLGPPPEGVEKEPNDTAGQANPLTFGAARTGLLTEGTDADTYRFTLVTQEHIRLTVTPPDDGSLQVRVSWEDGLDIGRRRYGNRGNTPYVLDTILQPGDYLVRLAAEQASDSPYTVLLEGRDPFEPLTDLEPNDAADLASPVPPTLVLRGTVEANDDEDWYALPKLAADTGLKIERAARLHHCDLRRQRAAADRRLPAGRCHGRVHRPALGRGAATVRLEGHRRWGVRGQAGLRQGTCPRACAGQAGCGTGLQPERCQGRGLLAGGAGRFRHPHAEQPGRAAVGAGARCPHQPLQDHSGPDPLHSPFPRREGGRGDRCRGDGARRRPRRRAGDPDDRGRPGRR